MDPMTLALLLGGGSFLSNLFGGRGGDDGDLSTFEGESVGGLSLDPRDLMGYGITNIARFGDQWEDLASRGISLPGAYAQATPTFSGGGLPMPIGLMSRDPAHDNPQGFLSLDGIGGNDPWQGLGNLMSGDPRNLPPRPPPTNPDEPDPDGGTESDWTPTRLRQAPGTDLMGGDDSESALAALELLGI